MFVAKQIKSHKSCLFDAPLAQLVEQLTLNQWVRGSSPRWRTTQKQIIVVCFFFYAKKEATPPDYFWVPSHKSADLWEPYLFGLRLFMS